MNDMYASASADAAAQNTTAEAHPGRLLYVEIVVGVPIVAHNAKLISSALDA